MQVAIIQTAIPFGFADEDEPPGVAAYDSWAAAGGGRGLPKLTYQKPLPNVIHQVPAFAGSAKTTTLELLTKAHPGIRFLYTAFNR